MSNYPEHERLSAVSDQSQVVGEFIEWVQSDGVQFMIWREDLTDTRPVDPECKARVARREHNEACKPPRPADGAVRADELYAANGVFYTMQHCTHWLDGGDCCLCEQGHVYEVTGIRGWVPERRSINELLAGFFSIDLEKIEDEKRAMLTAIRQEG